MERRTKTQFKANFITQRHHLLMIQAGKQRHKQTKAQTKAFK
jgi:hypothetical protein